ncbi:transcriptional regulator [Haloferax namakaokahaiae]|uniref:Transcriptional regulator n=1 Tax=Haloferax namakaokahaiae TaxID=1748331 RepID=A0ABD5ZB09_9EURY
MADLNRTAKRMYNIHPHSMYLTVGDIEGTFTLRSAEFFQTEFQAEGTRKDDDAVYRFTTTEDNETVIVGRQEAGEGGWTMVGEVETVERVDDEADD